MGRWMQKIQKEREEAPTKPAKPGFVGSVGTPCSPFQKTKPANDRLSLQQVEWLAAVASLLGVGTMHLIEDGFIDQYDLEEQQGADPSQVASLIRSNPRWHHPLKNQPSPHTHQAQRLASAIWPNTKTLEGSDENEH